MTSLYTFDITFLHPNRDRYLWCSTNIGKEGEEWVFDGHLHESTSKNQYSFKSDSNLMWMYIVWG